MHHIEAIARVLIIGVLLGAGLPAIFATGLLAYSFGVGGEEADHVLHQPNPPLKYTGVLLFVFVGLVIVTAVAWITRAAILHRSGVDLFPMFPAK